MSRSRMRHALGEPAVAVLLMLGVACGEAEVEPAGDDAEVPMGPPNQARRGSIPAVFDR